MDTITAYTPVPRPLSHQRPTQAYYVPRKLLECGSPGAEKPTKNQPRKQIGNSSADGDSCKKPTFGGRPQSPKEANERKESIKSRKNVQKMPRTRNEPRSLMSQIIPKPESLKQRKDVKLPQNEKVAILVEKLSELTTSTPRIVSPKIRSVSIADPHAFSSIAAIQKKIYKRSQAHVFCKCCGWEETIGLADWKKENSSIPCVSSIFLDSNILECPNPHCRSIHIFELL